MAYSGESYAYLFDQECSTMAGNARETLRHRNVLRYRAKTITSGDVVECEIYPIWNTQNEARQARAATTREAQRNLNAKNARKAMARKINANFTGDDLCITLTYSGGVPTEDQARRDIQNYLRRVRKYRRKRGLPELKYVYVIEFDAGEGAKPKKRVHHHVVMSGMDRDDAERLWGKGYANTRRLQPDEYGLEALARYLVKDPRGAKRWNASRNLKEPKVTVSDTKVSRRQAERIAEDFEEAAPRIFGRLFTDCEINDVEILRSDFVAGAYIAARMRRKKRTEGRHA